VVPGGTQTFTQTIGGSNAPFSESDNNDYRSLRFAPGGNTRFNFSCTSTDSSVFYEVSSPNNNNLIPQVLNPLTFTVPCNGTVSPVALFPILNSTEQYIVRIFTTTNLGPQAVYTFNVNGTP